MRNKAGRVSERLTDILEAIENVRDDIGALDRDGFLADGKTRRAVIESIIVIGEAANNLMRLAPQLEHDSPDIWQLLKDAYGMRIILTHEYFRVDASVVWDTVISDLPKLKAAVSQLCKPQHSPR